MDNFFLSRNKENKKLLKFKENCEKYKNKCKIKLNEIEDLSNKLGDVSHYT